MCIRVILDILSSLLLLLLWISSECTLILPLVTLATFIIKSYSYWFKPITGSHHLHFYFSSPHHSFTPYIMNSNCHTSGIVERIIFFLYLYLILLSAFFSFFSLFIVKWLGTKYSGYMTGDGRGDSGQKRWYLCFFFTRGNFRKEVYKDGLWGGECRGKK